ncbi:MAG: hypothetical protein IKH76_04090, partial [Clostridiales bacterium]|nr:hypothetical protein [Clostridiales bacterium]
SFKHIWYPYAFLIITAVPIYILDRAIDRNYMFLLRPIKGTPLAWLESFLGNPGYLVGVLVMLILVLAAVYGLLYVSSLWRSTSSAK